MYAMCVYAGQQAPDVTNLGDNIAYAVSSSPDVVSKRYMSESPSFLITNIGPGLHSQHTEERLSLHSHHNSSRSSSGRYILLTSQ